MQPDTRSPEQYLPPGALILEGVVGSIAYGLATPESDIDRKGVYAAPTEDLLGLDRPSDSWQGPEDQGDRTLYELTKFCLLALKTNPTITEVMWLPRGLYTTRTALGDELVELRRDFLSAPYVRSAYQVYATSQFGRLDARGDGSFSSTLRNRTAKHARHMARLVRQGFQLWRTGELNVELDDGQWYHAFGQQVAGGEDHPPDLDSAKALLHEYEQLFDETPTALPAEPNRDAVNSWVCATRRRLLLANHV